MAVEDFLETEVGVAVAATAALFAPPVRHGMRRGVVYALAGAMTAGEALAGGARAAVREGREAAHRGHKQVDEGGGNGGGDGGEQGWEGGDG